MESVLNMLKIFLKTVESITGSNRAMCREEVFSFVQILKVQLESCFSEIGSCELIIINNNKTEQKKGIVRASKQLFFNLFSFTADFVDSEWILLELSNLKTEVTNLVLIFMQRSASDNRKSIAEIPEKHEFNISRKTKKIKLLNLFTFKKFNSAW